jgi:hypothetical protein
LRYELPVLRNERSFLMLEPITLSALSAAALTEGIKFLYEQAGEVLKRWRERKDAAHGGTLQPSSAEPVEVRLPSVFAGQLSAPQIHFEAVERLETQLRGVRHDLSDYIEGIERVDMSNENLLRRIDALRQLLEAIYQQRLTFQGEHRPASGPVVKGSINVGTVAGYAVAVRAKDIKSGEVIAEAESERVEPGGQLTALDVETIGGESS